MVGFASVAGDRTSSVASPGVVPLSSEPTLHGFAGVSWWRLSLATVVAVALQVAVNYANDYSDGMRGTDADGVRIGPARLVGSGAVEPKQVQKVAIAVCVVACSAGLVLASMAGWWLIGVGAACVAAAWGYTGGTKPYGYAGLGEIFVFVFFGVVATAGTAYVLVERFEWLFVVVSIPVGLWAVSLLMLNNLRDVAGDKASKKNTLAVHVGAKRVKELFIVVLVISYLVSLTTVLWGRNGWVVCIALPFAVAVCVSLRRARNSYDLIGTLNMMSKTQLISGIGLACGLML